jgi:hypothetical protein
MHVTTEVQSPRSSRQMANPLKSSMTKIIAYAKGLWVSWISRAASSIIGRVADAWRESPRQTCCVGSFEETKDVRFSLLVPLPCQFPVVLILATFFAVFSSRSLLCMRHQHKCTLSHFIAYGLCGHKAAKHLSSANKPTSNLIVATATITLSPSATTSC